MTDNTIDKELYTINLPEQFGWGGQVAGSHYTRWVVEPAWFCTVNNWSTCPANTLKYVMRFDNKNGIEDLVKAFDYGIKYIEFLRYANVNKITIHQPLGYISCGELCSANNIKGKIANIIRLMEFHNDEEYMLQVVSNIREVIVEQAPYMKEDLLDAEKDISTCRGTYINIYNNTPKKGNV